MKKRKNKMKLRVVIGRVLVVGALAMLLFWFFTTFTPHHSVPAAPPTATVQITVVLQKVTYQKTQVALVTFQTNTAGYTSAYISGLPTTCVVGDTVTFSTVKGTNPSNAYTGDFKSCGSKK